MLIHSHPQPLLQFRTHTIDRPVDRMRRSHFVLGESGMSNSSRKLTVEQVLEVRLCYIAGEREWARLAKKFGVSREAIKAAAVGLTFKELPMPPKRVLNKRPFPYG
jgi:hypothetical protein